MIACLKRELEKKKKEREREKELWVSLIGGKERGCKKERGPVSYPLFPHLCSVPGSQPGAEEERKVAPVLRIHGLMGREQKAAETQGQLHGPQPSL